MSITSHTHHNDREYRATPQSEPYKPWFYLKLRTCPCPADREIAVTKVVRICAEKHAVGIESEIPATNAPDLTASSTVLMQLVACILDLLDDLVKLSG